MMNHGAISDTHSFGYDTGQISGFLEMPNFLMRFGQKKADGKYYFSDVRSGLIVAMVSPVLSQFTAKRLITYSSQLVHSSGLSALHHLPIRSVEESPFLSGVSSVPLDSSFRSQPIQHGIK